MRGAALLLVLAGAAIAHAAAEETGRPITKVIRVLKDMSETIKKEAKEDEEVYKKLTCWCQSNDRERTKKIAEEKQTIQLLQDAIENSEGASGGAQAKKTNLESDVATMKNSLADAKAIRNKEKAAFVAAEKDLVQSIQALKSAVQVLKKHNKGAFAQIRTMISFEAAKHADILDRGYAKHQHRQLDAFLQQPVGSESGEIFGILTNMLETFEKDLADSQEAEKTAQATFEELRGDKMQELSDAEAQLQTTTTALANSEQKKADDKEALEDTQESLAQNEEFLAKLKEQCKMTDDEMEQRTKTRNEELGAIAKAIEILSGDNATATFANTKGISFVQTDESSATREKAFAFLKQKAAVLHSTKLFEAAQSTVKLDAFLVVVDKINALVEELEKEQLDDKRHKDVCTEELNDNASNTARKNDEIDAANAFIAQKTEEIKTLNEELAALKADNADMERSKLELSSTRATENTDFQQIISDQRDTQNLIQQAIDALNVFYAKENGSSFAQQAQEPPVQFKKYKKQGGNIVIDMLVQVKADAKLAETEGMAAEKAAQLRYEEEMMRLNGAIDANDATIALKTGNLGDAESDKNNKEAEQRNNHDDMEALMHEANHIHDQCDFLLKNFDLRQTKRRAEIEALQEAKNILQGMGMEFGFLQRKH